MGQPIREPGAVKAETLPQSQATIGISMASGRGKTVRLLVISAPQVGVLAEREGPWLPPLVP